MKFTDSSVYGGPNLYTLFPVIRHRLDMTSLSAKPNRRLEASFSDRLVNDLPGLRGDEMLKGADDDPSLQIGQALARTAVELQRLAGADVFFGEVRPTSETGHYDIVYAYEQREIGLAAGLFALAQINHLLRNEVVEPEAQDPQFDFAETLDAFLYLVSDSALNYNAMILVRAAQERGIPWMEADALSPSLLGHGRHARQLYGTLVGASPPNAVKAAEDKRKTVQILEGKGLPVPRQRLVHTKKDALKTAKRIGGPVVVKPLDARHGRGVSTRLTAPASIGAAFDEAYKQSHSVLVESFIEGDDHRMLVVDGKLIATTMRIPGHVIGDGEKTIEALVDEVNSDPRRGPGHIKPLTYLELDEQAYRLLQKLSYTKDTVPDFGERVYLRGVANLSAGGSALDLTDAAHEDNRELAVRAAEAIGLRIAGVDFLTPDVSKSYKEVGGAICEINADPALSIHVSPEEIVHVDVVGPILDLLYPPGTPSRIPIAGVAGTNNNATTTHMVAHILKLAGHTVGLTTTEGAYVDGERTADGEMMAHAATRAILCNPNVEAAVLELPPDNLMLHGMSCDRCTVGAAMSVSNDQLGVDGIDSVETLAAINCIVIQAAEDTAVLNADDELCRAMAEHTNARHICYVTMREQNSFVAEHIISGGRAVTLETESGGTAIVLNDARTRVPVMPLDHVTGDAQSALFATAICFALGANLDHIRQGLEEFAAAVQP